MSEPQIAAIESGSSEERLKKKQNTLIWAGYSWELLSDAPSLTCG